MNKSEWIRVAFFLGLFIGGVAVSYSILTHRNKLPFYNPSQLNPSVVDSSVRGVTKFHKTMNFSLISQSGKTVTQDDFKGKIYVTDFFFTTCQTICPKMTTQLKRVYEEFEDNDKVMFLSHTVMPEIDSVQVLAEYALEIGAKENRWKFVTGHRDTIFSLARISYFAVSDEGNDIEGDFVHTENFVLVDKNRRLRGFYDGTSTKDVDRLIEDIELLLEEE